MVVGDLGQRLVGHELRLRDDARRGVHRLDLVEDRGHRALDERHQPGGLHADGLAGPVDAHDPAEVARPAGLHSRLRVLEDRRLGRLRTETSGGGQERVGRRLAREPVALGHDAVDHVLEELIDPGRDKHVAAVRARRDDGPAQPLFARRLGEPDRALVRLDALLADQLENPVVLARAQRVDGLRCGGSCGEPIGRSIPRDCRNECTPSRRGLPSTYSS